MTEAAGPEGAAWTLDFVDGLLLLRCAALQRIDGIAHAFSTTRHDRGGAFDLGTAEDQSESMRERRSRFLSAAGIDGDAMILRQVHGDRLIDGDAVLDAPPEADGAIWTGGSSVPAVRSADCVPLLLVDRAGRAAAAVHAGWRGTAAGITRRAVGLLAERGVPPADLIAAIGPAIGPCCYEVGGEVVEALGDKATTAEAMRARPGGATARFRVDLKEINREHLLESGLPEDAIHAAPWCTWCRADLFFSFRREGGKAGRMMAAVGRRRRP